MKTIKLLLPTLLLLQTFVGVQAKKNNQEYIPMDYSYCGYHASEKCLPQTSNTLYVKDAKMVQSAIDYLATKKTDKDGHRGTILLAEGIHYIDDPIRINSSGIVLRGCGRDKTIIVKRGIDRGAAIYIQGQQKVLTPSSTFKIGNRIAISWTGNKEWIAMHKCDDFGGGLDYTGWKDGDINIVWDRTITAINANTIYLDAPITMFSCTDSIDTHSALLRFNDINVTNEISESGVENLTIQSEITTNNPKDEDHNWDGIYMDNARDCWVKLVNISAYAGSAVNLQKGCSRITVEDCIASAPISEIGGWRRDAFLVRGQQILVQRCVSKEGIHDFVADYCAAGPNAFVQCEAQLTYGFSGSIGAWAPGLLFDIVDIDRGDLKFKNLEQFRTGTGWNTANSMFWQCTAANIHCYSPDANNKNSGHGCWGCLWGDGEWTMSNEHVKPRSLFYAQLEKRLKKNAIQQEVNPYILPRSLEATSSPTLEQAHRMTEASQHPRLTLEVWIDSVNANSLMTQVGGIKEWTKNNINDKVDNLTINQVTIEDGLRYAIPWWNGRTKDNWVKKSAKPAITRFVPGRNGLGWTDDIDDVVAFLKKHHFKSLEHNYGLWYDIRRTDHERMRRADGQVEAPFYEQPFARTGQGTGWDGLSLYDLTKPNKWYWMRLREFARKAAKENILLYHNMYFQHNILEAGAHWVDCPWRPVNNINGTTFPEPVPFAGDKRLFMAEQFYNEQDSVLRPLHKNFIRMCLEQLKDEPNVVHFLSAEYSGPLHFTRFWVETIAEWEAETGKHPIIALSTTKDATDAILSDPKLAKVIDVIDIRYWHYNEKGLWQMTEGKNLAPRQWMRIMPIGKSSKADRERAINEYKEKYPDKVVIYNAF